MAPTAPVCCTCGVPCPDAGTGSDAGPYVDAGSVPDAGTESDTGVSERPGGALASAEAGCVCVSAAALEPSGSAVLLGFIGLLLFRRRRRTRQ